MATKQLTMGDTYVLPRVNLLPPEIGAKKAEQRSYALMGVSVAAAGAAVVALYLGQASRVSAAKDELQLAKSENTKLKSDRSKLQTIEDTYAAVEADEALLTRALERRVLWSVYLHNISIGIPENVWVTQFSASVAVPNAATAASTSAGTVTVAGSAFAYNDVAAWLESLAKMKGLGNAAFSNAAKEKPKTSNGRTIIKFTSSASLTPAAITPHKKPGSR